MENKEKLIESRCISDPQNCYTHLLLCLVSPYDVFFHVYSTYVVWRKLYHIIPTIWCLFSPLTLCGAIFSHQQRLFNWSVLFLNSLTVLAVAQWKCSPPSRGFIQTTQPFFPFSDEGHPFRNAERAVLSVALTFWAGWRALLFSQASAW